MSNLTEESKAVFVKAEWLCGEAEVFWDAGVFWSQDYPEFSECMVRFVWSFLPSLVFWALLPLVLVKTFLAKGSAKRSSLSVNLLNLAKSALALLLVLLAVFDLVSAVLQDSVN